MANVTVPKRLVLSPQSQGLGALRELIQYRYLWFELTLSELRTRYKGSVLGFLWAFANPLLTLIVYSIVFSNVMRIRMPHYSAFLLIGILSWNMFASAVQASAGVVVRQAGLVKKIYFPRQVLPLAVVGGSVMNYLFSCVILLPFLVAEGYYPTISWLWLIPLTLCEAVMAAGFALLVSAANVYLRDVEHVLSIVLMLWFYITPIVYTPSMMPGRLSEFFKLNPLSGCILGFQSVLYYHSPLHWKLELYSMSFAVVVFVIGWFVFSWLSKRFAEEI